MFCFCSSRQWGRPTAVAENTKKMWKTTTRNGWRSRPRAWLIKQVSELLSRLSGERGRVNVDLLFISWMAILNKSALWDTAHVGSKFLNKKGTPSGSNTLLPHSRSQHAFSFPYLISWLHIDSKLGVRVKPVTYPTQGMLMHLCGISKHFAWIVHYVHQLTWGPLWDYKPLIHIRDAKPMWCESLVLSTVEEFVVPGLCAVS